MGVTALILNWNELEVVKDSARRLLKEPGVSEVIVVDNGSTDGSKEYFRERAGIIVTAKDAKNKIQDLKFTNGNQKLTFIDWPENAGASVARNLGIAIAKQDYVFLIDGDILYVPGTIKEYQKVLDKYQDAACVGQNSFELLAQLGHNGTLDPIEADVAMSEDYTISDWFPMAWTQYGLFRTQALRDNPFIEEPPYNEAGYGFEDDDMYHQLKKAGWACLAVDKPIYYHFAHSGIRELLKADMELKFEQRKAVFDKRWGKKGGWAEAVARGIEKTTRPK